MTTKEIKVYKDLMGENSLWAGKIREYLKEKNIIMMNLIGSPGSGKTALLERIKKSHFNELNFSVLEGDVETVNDARRLHDIGVEVFQLLSGGSCHLEAKLVYHALKDLSLKNTNTVFVENVGNLVCPAEFDIGENAKIAFLSVTEGEDKPLKYPLLFREAKACILTKTDLLQYIDYNLEMCKKYIKEVNPEIKIFEVCSLKDVGVKEVCRWMSKDLK